MNAKVYSGQCGDNLTWTLNSETGELKIEGTGVMWDWSGVGAAPWSEYIDLMKKDSEIKLLIGCTEEEMKTVYNFHNDSEFMKGILIRR